MRYAKCPATQWWATPAGVATPRVDWICSPLSAGSKLTLFWPQPSGSGWPKISPAQDIRAGCQHMAQEDELLRGRSGIDHCCFAGASGPQTGHGARRPTGPTRLGVAQLSDGAVALTGLGQSPWQDGDTKVFDLHRSSDQHRGHTASNNRSLGDTVQASQSDQSPTPTRSQGDQRQPHHREGRGLGNHQQGQILSKTPAQLDLTRGVEVR